MPQLTNILQKTIAEQITRHAFERIFNRLTELLDLKSANKIFNYIDSRAAQSKYDSEAIRIIKLSDIYGIPWSDISNGDEVWAIIRDRRVVTIMFRRSSQPKTPWALNVKKVTLDNLRLN